ncbi:MAG: Lrp/AsnC ligand binding domain-containing protein [Candidatus Saelkia tenebricola]|nr:Lrp/AsnC ligand binding domain-containing protein [Candidatus Saelkia tenebricola]
MAKAYLKINVEPGQERDIKKQLLSREDVLQADLTSGEQDIVALVEAANYEELMSFVVSELRLIEGITKTITNLILD